MAALKDAMLDDNTAVVMFTVPNTLGIFESRIGEITKMAHDRGAVCVTWMAPT